MASGTKNLTNHVDNFSDTVGANMAVVNGFGGNDILSTAVATSIINGGAGNDSITSTLASGRDYLYGGLGNDTIVANGGAAATTYGGQGNDSITATSGAVYLSGDMGNDTLTGGVGNQSMYGGMGNDNMFTGTDASTTDKHFLYGGASNDSLSGANSAGLDYLYGGIGNNTIVGGTSGHDWMNAGYGSTMSATGVITGVGTNVITGGAGNALNETVAFGDATVGITVNLNTATAQVVNAFATDTITNVDNLWGSAFNDTLTANIAGGTISGGAGADVINTGAAYTGNETLLGGLGNDTINVYTTSTSNGFTVNADSIDGGTGVNVVSFTNVTPVGAGVTLNTGAAGVDTVALPSTSSGTYTMTSASITGVYVNLSATIDNNGTENFTGAGGAGTLTNVQRVIGTTGNDYMVAGGTNSTLEGGAGNDTLVSAQSGSGHDVLVGGAGTNVYDGTTSGLPNYYALSQVSGETDNIFGYNALTNADHIYISLASGIGGTASTFANLGVAGVGTIGTTTGTANSTIYLGGGAVAGNSVLTETFNSAGKLATIGLDTSAVVQVTSASDVTAAVSTHAEFIYNSTTGDLGYLSAGAAAGAAFSTIAHIDTNSATFNTLITHSAANIDNTDFILVN